MTEATLALPGLHAVVGLIEKIFFEFGTSSQ